MGGGVANISSVRSKAAARPRFTPGDSWPRRPALETYLLPVTHRSLPSCPCHTYHPPPTGQLGTCLLASCQEIRARTSAHKLLLLLRLPRQ